MSCFLLFSCLGKTYTMSGPSDHPGIIPRAITDLFKLIHRETTSSPHKMFLVRMSYVELYNDQFRNLIEPFVRREEEESEQEGVFDDELSLSSSLSSSSSSFFAQRETSSSLARSHNGKSLLKERRLAATKIEVKESPSGGVYLSGPHLRATVTSPQQAFRLFLAGNEERVTAATGCNDQSSRSHAILTIHVECQTTDPVTRHTEISSGKLHLIDLAGSERLSLSGSEGASLVEAQNINLSLSHLGHVLNVLGRNAMIDSRKERRQQKGRRQKRGEEGGRKNEEQEDEDDDEESLASFSSLFLGEEGGGAHRRPSLSKLPVTYRDSKLTFLLKDSLGGNAKTVMVATISPAADNYEESLSTLRWAGREGALSRAAPHRIASHLFRAPSLAPPPSPPPSSS